MCQSVLCGPGPLLLPGLIFLGFSALGVLALLPTRGASVAELMQSLIGFEAEPAPETYPKRARLKEGGVVSSIPVSKTFCHQATYEHVVVDTG